MKIQLKYSYTNFVTPPRCRLPRKITFSDGILDFEIPEISVTQAPIAIRSTGIQSWEPETRFMVDYRWYANKLWTRVNVHNCSLCSYTARQQDYEHKLPASIVDITLNNSCYELGLRSSAYETKKQVESDLRIQLSEMLLIDGVMHKPAGEPRYLVATFGLGNNHGSTALFAEDCYNSNISKDRYFNLLERERAFEYATNLARSRDDTKSLPMKVNGDNQFEILIPEAIKVMPQAQHGDGDPFLNKLENICTAKPGAFAAMSIMAALSNPGL